MSIQKASQLWQNWQSEQVKSYSLHDLFYLYIKTKMKTQGATFSKTDTLNGVGSYPTYTDLGYNRAVN